MGSINPEVHLAAAMLFLLKSTVLDKNYFYSFSKYVLRSSEDGLPYGFLSNSCDIVNDKLLE